jgi:hypothetical protein
MIKTIIVIILSIAAIALCYYCVFKKAVEIDPKSPLYDDEFETEGTQNYKLKKK